MPATQTPPSTAELLDRLGRLDSAVRSEWLGTLNPLESEHLAELLARGVRRPWSEVARAEQLPPEGNWFVWLILAGRGFGKTAAGSNWSAQFMRDHPGCRFALVGPTFADGRDTMVEGETGLLSTLEDHELRGGRRDKAWNRSMGELFLANGARARVFSSEKPDSLRGPQHHGAWVDEPAKMHDVDHFGIEGVVTTWDNLMLGLRLGENPRVMVSGTPTPCALLRGRREQIGGHERWVPGIPEMEGTVVTRGSTYDNLANLAPTFRQQILSRYEGTRIGLQELEGQILTDVVGALWRLQWIRRREDCPETFERAVVAIDPAVTATDAADETGIIAAGIDDKGHPWVLADRSGRYSADGWATAAVELAGEYGAAIIVEDNQGGDLVVDAVRRADRDVEILRAHAVASKEARAQPVAQVYERAAGIGAPVIVWHLPGLAVLEDQMTTWVPGQGRSPDRVDALVWAVGTLLGIHAVKRPRRLHFTA